jgi:Ca-activated chloride channel family protein
VAFIWPLMLLSLLFVPLCGLLYMRLRQRRVVQLGTLGFGPQEVRHRPGWRRHFPLMLFLFGLTLLLMALARPEMAVSLPRVEGTIFLVFDVSNSMTADDLEPTRMEAAKTAAYTLVENQPGRTQIGVVAFSDGGIMVQRPTNDKAITLATISRLTPQGGTSLGQGILVALNSIAGEDEPEPMPAPTPVPAGTYSPAIIVLLSDGENTAPPDPIEAAHVAADRGVRIHTVGIGSQVGTTLEIEGFTVHTQLDEAALQHIALITDGSYYNAENEEALNTMYDNLETQLTVKSEKMEVTSIFAGVSVLVLLIGGAFSLLWYGRLP